MATLSTVIMAHPVRRDWARQLSQDLGGAPVQYDPVRKPSSDPEQRWANGRQAWQKAAAAKAEWSMVIQDDAVPAVSLTPALRQALDHVPEQCVVNPYLGTKRPRQHWAGKLAHQAKQHQASWAVGRSLNWGVAIIVPTHTVPHMITWCNQQAGMTYDMRIGRYYRDQLGWPCWHTWPSLVDHRQAPSLVGNGQRGRHAHHHHPGDALTLDWTGPVVQATNLPAARHATQT